MPDAVEWGDIEFGGQEWIGLRHIAREIRHRRCFAFGTFQLRAKVRVYHNGASKTTGISFDTPTDF
jgi:hypothetical protein